MPILVAHSSPIVDGTRWPRRSAPPKLELSHDAWVLLEAISEGLGGESRLWVRRDPYSPAPEEIDEWSWDRFATLVKHDRRFFLLSHRYDHDTEFLSPRNLLERIAKLCATHDIIRTLPTGSSIHRVRKLGPGETATTPLELGPPPAEKVIGSSTRMSPAGIPMVYGAEDARTALCETWDGAGRYVTARFVTKRDALLLDLTNIPRIPSIFEPVSDTAESDPRYELMFLHHFAREVSKPIDRKNRAHVDYVPTQVVSEFFRSFPLQDGRRLDGILYYSVQCVTGICIALYARQEDVVPSDEDTERCRAADHFFIPSESATAWLELAGTRHQTIHRRPR